MITSKSSSYSFHSAVVLRTPRFPFCTDWTEQAIISKLEDPVFMEAVYLASPVLHKECLKLREGLITDQKSVQKILNSLVKYLSRMSSRSTPFGLFSGTSVLNWKAEETQVNIDSKAALRHTRLDMHYLCALAEKLGQDKFISSSLVYHSNSSLHQFSQEIRYIESRYINNNRTHQLSAVSTSSYLTVLLEMGKKGVTYKEMAAYLKGEGIKKKDAIAFIEEIVGAQLLVSELEAAITGEEFIYQLLDSLNRILKNQYHEFTQMVYDTLLEVDHRIKEIDQNGVNRADAYENIESLLDKLDVPYEKGKLFQTDLNMNAQGHIDQDLQKDLLEAAGLLNSLCDKENHSHLIDFKIRFRERYEDKFMPLLEVLDIESGLGYIKDNHQHITPLIEGLSLSSPTQNHYHDDSETSRLLWRKMKEAITSNAYEITIEKEDYINPGSDWTAMPPSMSVIFRVLGNKEKNILLDGCTGTSAANLLGRFSHLDQKIDDLIEDITSQEKSINKDIAFAEIVHLPESRTGNILQRKVYRDYEIPYLGKSMLANERQIQPSDLMIGIREDKIILFSKKLGKEIIPRLSTAHNYSHLSLPVYQFLCDLQNQGLKENLFFNWGDLAKNFQFLPRVKFKKIILSAAKWQLTQADIHTLYNGDDEMLRQNIAALQAKWGLPRYVTLVDQDNELLIDFDNLITVKPWIKLVKNRSSLLLKEFIFDTASGIVSPEGGTFANQMIASIVKNNTVYHPTRLSGLNNDPVVVRKFAPGSEWLFYKFYCGMKSADKILSSIIQPVIEELKYTGYINKWFFIRYNDPDFHLRVRFHLTDIKHLGAVMQVVNKYMVLSKEQDGIWNTQIDTYQREIERYGDKNIEQIEELFYIDSEAFLNFLALTGGDEREDVRWIWAMRNIDAILDDFHYSRDEKLGIVRSVKEGFIAELKPDKSVRVHINKKFAENGLRISQIMNKTNDLYNPLSELISLTDEKSCLNQEIVKGLMEIQHKENPEIKINNLIGHLLHMSLNRLFISEARVQEMVIYELLDRYYTSLKAREIQSLRESA